MRSSLLWCVAAALVLPVLGHVDRKKDVQPPVAPGPPTPPSPPADSGSTTLTAAASSTETPASSLDISAFFASLSSELTASIPDVDTSAILASLSSQYHTSLSLSSSSTSCSSTATTTSSNAGSAPTTSSTSSGQNSIPTANTANKDSISSSGADSRRKTLIIVLAVVLSTFGITLLAIAFLCMRRYTRGLTPFSRLAKRGASPIDDDEIATWRTSPAAMAQTSSGSPHNHNHTRTASSVIFNPSPSHSWTVLSPPNSNSSSPMSLPYFKNQVQSQFVDHTQYYPYSPDTILNNEQPPKSLRSGSIGRCITEPTIPEPAALTARAPNSRSGLTDETVPGADPFLPLMKRQSTRLSKANTPGHARTKSRRSSKGSVASAHGNAISSPITNGNGTAPFELGRFSLDRDRKGSLSERNGTGLGMNPFVGATVGNGGDPYEHELVGGGGLWPPPRKGSFPNDMVGVAS